METMSEDMIIDVMKEMAVCFVNDCLLLYKHEYEILKKHCYEKLAGKKTDKLTYFYGKRIIIIEGI